MPFIWSFSFGCCHQKQSWHMHNFWLMRCSYERWIIQDLTFLLHYNPAFMGYLVAATGAPFSKDFHCFNRLPSVIRHHHFLQPWTAVLLS
jgi:hypothetical protein